MRFEEILKKYEHIKLAQPSDNKRIIDFLRSVPMVTSSISLRYYFEDDIWKFLNYQGTNTYVFLFTKKNNSIYGYAVISLRKYYVLGKKHTSAYLSDLRTAPSLNSKERKEWKNCTNDILSNFKKIDELKNVSYFYGAIFEKNFKAMRSFHNKKFPVNLIPLFSYRAISVLSRRPLTILSSLLNKKIKYRIEKAQKKDEFEIRQFLHQQNITKFWGEHFSSPKTDNANDEWSRRKKDWSCFDIEKFLIVKNAKNEIIFCTMPWAPYKTRKIVVEKIQFKFRLLGYLFYLIGKKTLIKGEPLRTLYLTHFEIKHKLEEDDRFELIDTLLQYLYKNKFQKEFHNITFCDFYDSAISKVLKKYFIHLTKAKLFQITSKTDNNNLINTPTKFSPQMSFEAAIV